MSTLFTSLSSSVNSLAGFERALTITQNNIGNASTPGYAEQNVVFDSGPGSVNGVTTSSSRDPYADQSVRQEVSKQGTAVQLTSSLTGVEGLFDVTGQTGVSASLNKLLNGFSALSVTPNDPSARQNVIGQAQGLVTDFQKLSSSLATASSNAEGGIASNVAAINALGKQIQGYNVERVQTTQADPALDAKVNAALESLSQIANITASTAPDGSTRVLLGGQTPLVIGAEFSAVQSGIAPAGNPPPANPGGVPSIQIQDSTGKDITAQISDGTLAGFLQVRNTSLAAVRGDRSQQGSLNQLAQSVADRVNGLLTSGNISTGPPPVPGVALFTYDATNPTGIAKSLSVNPAITGAKIATIDPGPPASSNGIANKLSQIAQGTDPQDQINGFSFTTFFGQIASGVGSELSAAKSNSDLQAQAVTQAKNLQAQFSGVSLDTEAVKLLQFQNSYAATAKLINILDQVAQTTLSILP